MLSLIYLTAFASLGLQVAGFIGSQSILPAAPFLSELRQRLGRRAYWQAPTVFWLNASDWALAGWAFVFLQLLILLTGSHTFCNLPAMALCVLLLDNARLDWPEQKRVRLAV